MKYGEGNFGGVLETKKSLVKKVRGKSNAVELKRGLHGVKWVVVVKEELR